jgi:ribosomal protein L31
MCQVYHTILRQLMTSMSVWKQEIRDICQGYGNSWMEIQIEVINLMHPIYIDMHFFLKWNSVSTKDPTFVN